MPQIHLLPQIQKSAGKCRPIWSSHFFRFRRTDRVDSVMKALMGQCPSPEFWARTAPVRPFDRFCSAAGSGRKPRSAGWRRRTSRPSRVMGDLTAAMAD